MEATPGAPRLSMNIPPGTEQKLREMAARHATTKTNVVLNAINVLYELDKELDKPDVRLYIRNRRRGRESDMEIKILWPLV